LWSFILNGFDGLG